MGKAEFDLLFFDALYGMYSICILHNVEDQDYIKSVIHFQVTVPDGLMNRFVTIIIIITTNTGVVRALELFLSRVPIS